MRNGKREVDIKVVTPSKIIQTHSIVSKSHKLFNLEVLLKIKVKAFTYRKDGKTQNEGKMKKINTPIKRPM